MQPYRRPWTAEEDEALREICRVGLASEFWSTAIPTRSFNEVVERRLDLKPQLAPLL